MKSLRDYLDTKQTDIFEKYGVFFAFSNAQLAEKQVEGVEYRSMGAGMICPLEYCKIVRQELNDSYEEAVKQHRAENSDEDIIRYELCNYECYYTGDISDAVDALSSYGFTVEKIKNVFNAEYRRRSEAGEWDV